MCYQIRMTSGKSVKKIPTFLKYLFSPTEYKIKIKQLLNDIN